MQDCHKVSARTQLLLITAWSLSMLLHVHGTCAALTYQEALILIKTHGYVKNIDEAINGATDEPIVAEFHLHLHDHIVCVTSQLAFHLCLHTRASLQLSATGHRCIDSLVLHPQHAYQ